MLVPVLCVKNIFYPFARVKCSRSYFNLTYFINCDTLINHYLKELSMSNDVQKKPSNLMEILKSYESDYIQSSVTDSDNFARECTFAHQALTKNDFLLSVAKNNPLSLKQAIINIGATGLSLNPVSQYAYLIPRKINGKMAVCLDISYKGICKAATDSGSVEWVQAHIVKEKDSLSIGGAGEKPDFRYEPFKDRGAIVGAFCVAKLYNGDFLTTPMSVEEINEIRDASEAFKKGHGPWINFWGEMAKKTVVKRAAKMFPKTDRHLILENAIAVENEINGIDFEAQAKEQLEEKKLLEQDFPRNPDDMVYGPRYFFTTTKFQGKRLGECDHAELEKYFVYISKQVEKDKRYQSGEKWEAFQRIKDYLERFKEYNTEPSDDDLDELFASGYDAPDDIIETLSLGEVINIIQGKNEE